MNWPAAGHRHGWSLAFPAICVDILKKKITEDHQNTDRCTHNVQRGRQPALGRYTAYIVVAFELGFSQVIGLAVVMALFTQLLQLGKIQ